MATTPSTSISSSYQRLSGGTPVITQTGGPGGGGPRLVAKQTLKQKALEEFEAEKAVNEARKQEQLKQIMADPYLSEKYRESQAARSAYAKSAQQDRGAMQRSISAANPFGSAGPELSASARSQAIQKYSLDKERGANRAAKEEAQYRANYKRQYGY